MPEDKIEVRKYSHTGVVEVQLMTPPLKSLGAKQPGYAEDSFYSIIKDSAMSIAVVPMFGRIEIGEA